ncbi:hypothetical protein HNP55_003489 [Paucibacter oligotrophus]|uniref:DUF1178 family protein n=1 Tax=Roseateles oligotrophus TaxID=1769250 RepID=A0A840LE53_9BURK|nr:DUF1178 family protein [Roseateles oligotrophus]MBB4844943.1 hypothetical protein [Roseateles oligotrophus]
MLVLNLACSSDHRFEGWFGSNADFQSQTERGLLSCPVCADAKVKRMPSAPHLNVSHLRQQTPPPARPDAGQARQAGQGAAAAVQPALSKPAPPAASQPIAAGPDPRESMQVLQAKLMQALQQVVQQVEAHTEDVGTQFAEEARRIHYGESPERGIRGQATRDEAAALEDEGISILALPLPVGRRLQ